MSAWTWIIRGQLAQAWCPRCGKVTQWTNVKDIRPKPAAQDSGYDLFTCVSCNTMSSAHPHEEWQGKEQGA